MRFTPRKNFSAFGLCAALSLAICGVTARQALAATTSNTFAVSASVTNSCTVSGTALAFGAYVPTATTDHDDSSTITVLCTLNDSYNIRLNKGLNGASVSARQMSDGASHSLNYALYRDSSRAQNWGETDGTDTVASTGTGADQTFTVYGRIPASQNVPQGTYTDTITITVNF